MLGDIDQVTMEEMRWLMDVNLWGTVNITQALLPALRREPAAHITHLVSIYGLAAPAGRIPYAMSKFAVRGFTESLRHELEDSTVSVGAIYPAGVKTGIILHGRYAAAIDPAVAQRAAAAQAAMYHTEPADGRAPDRRGHRTAPRSHDGRSRGAPRRPAHASHADAVLGSHAQAAQRSDRHDDARRLRTRSGHRHRCRAGIKCRGPWQPPAHLAGHAYRRKRSTTKGAIMGFLDDAKETAEAVGDKIKDTWEDTKDRMDDKVDEAKADADVKKAEAERDSVKTRNDIKEELRDS